MDAAPWLQDVGTVKQPPSLDVSSSAAKPPAQLAEKRTRPQKEQALNCPRCNSTSTKFCYFNNYSLTQPRYFCKTCRRYWTEGGSLRNVPVGGGSRKNKRPSSSSSSSAAASSSAAPSKKLQQDPLIAVAQPAMENPSKYMEAHDLNLGFSHHPLPGSDFPRFPPMKGNPPTVDLGADGLSSLELLRSGLPRGMGSPFMTMAAIQDNTPGVYPHGGAGGYMLQEFRPGSVAFPLDGIGVPGGNSSGYENMQDVDGGGGGSGGRVMFPFEDLSQVPPSSSSTGATTLPASGFDQRSQADSSGFWNRLMGGGGATW